MRLSDGLASKIDLLFQILAIVILACVAWSTWGIRDDPRSVATERRSERCHTLRDLHPDKSLAEIPECLPPR